MAQGLGNGIEAIVEKRFQSFEGLILDEQGNPGQKEMPREPKEEPTRGGHGTIAWLLGEQEPMPAPLRDRAKDKASKMLGLTADELDGAWLYSICDEALAQRGQVQDREVYIYREGFYRSLAIALSLLCISLLASVWRTLAFGDVSTAALGVSLGWPDLLAFAGVSAAGAWLACRRYVRFGCYRVRQAVTGFLVLKEEVQPDDNKAAGGTITLSLKI